MFKTYYHLTKPGIIYGNAISAAGGFFLASRGNIDLMLFLGMLFGIALVIACGCVLNNYIDRGIDAKMARTKHRAIVEGRVSGRQAIVYAAVLGVLGGMLLALATNALTVYLALLGLVFYVVIYGVTKRRTVYGTIVGSVSGAVPIAVGYVAVTGRFDTGALILVLILILWQMPHFYAIAIYRADDYRAAGLPVLPLKQGIPITKVHILLYITAFLGATAALTIFGYTGYTYLIAMAVVGLAWLRLSLKGFVRGIDDARWARKLFGQSLIVLLVFSFIITLDILLP